MTSSMYSVLSEESDLDPKASTASSNGEKPLRPWYAHLLTLEDLVQVDPNRGKFLQQLQVCTVIFIFIQCSPLKRPCCLIGQFSQIRKDQFTSNLPG